MKAFPRLQRAIVGGAMVLAAVAGSGSELTAQGSPKPDFEPDFFESMLTGFEIEISNEDFVIDDVFQQNYVDGENELIYISSDTSLIEVSFFNDEDSPAETLEMWTGLLESEMDDFRIIEEGEEGEITWIYAVATLDGDDFGYYVQTEAGVFDDIYILESVLTPDGNLTDAVDEAQQAISIDGDPFMDNVDLDDLQDVVDGNASR